MGSLNFSVSKWDSFTVSVSFYSHRSMPLVHASLSIFGCRACTSLLIIALLCHVVCLYYSVDIILVTVFSIIVYPHPSTYCYYYLFSLLDFIWFLFLYTLAMLVVQRILSVGSECRFHRRRLILPVGSSLRTVGAPGRPLVAPVPTSWFSPYCSRILNRFAGIGPSYHPDACFICRLVRP